MSLKILLVVSQNHEKSAEPSAYRLSLVLLCLTYRWSGHDNIIQKRCAESEHFANQSLVLGVDSKPSFIMPPLASASESLLKPTLGGISYPPRPKSATNRPASAFRSCYWAKNYRLGDLNSKPAASPQQTFFVDLHRSNSDYVGCMPRFHIW